MFKNLFQSKAKREQLAAEQRELEYRNSCEAEDRARWAKVSDQQLAQLRTAMQGVYQRAKAYDPGMKKPYGLKNFNLENLFSPDEILSIWKADSYTRRKQGFGMNDPGLERRMYAKLRLSYEFYWANMKQQTKASLGDVLQTVDEYMSRFCWMDVDDAAEVFRKKYPYY